MRAKLSLACIVLAGLSGCQGIGGYSAQSITRVPPIGTWSNQATGNYYGNSAPSTAAAPPANSNAAMQSSPNTSALPSTGIDNAGNFSLGANSSTATTAAYELPAGSPVGSGVSSASTNSANLQWKR